MQRTAVNRRKGQALRLQGYLVRYDEEQKRHLWYADEPPTVARRRENAASLARLHTHRKKRR